LHSALQPLGTHAQFIHGIWQVLVWVCGVMYVLVLAFIAMTIMRQRRAVSDNTLSDDASAAAQHAQQRRMMVTLIVWGAVITAGLFGLTLMSFFTDRGLLHAADRAEVEITVTAHQWWWEVEYEDQQASGRLKTANEIHLPVNTPARITLVADDVIHSFWVPNLHGKVDLIPGRNNEIRLQPVKTGRYRGECAEFCGTQHAHMAFDVIVHSAEDYSKWKESQSSAASAPTTQIAQHGQHVFLNGPCATCHAVAGTDAMATTGPDLSHVASRTMLAAGSLPNNDDNMRSWLQNSQRIKPGNHMPEVPLSSDDVNALVAYLGSLR
jgi:cytochrome c oxidase subunit 2